MSASPRPRSVPRPTARALVLGLCHEVGNLLAGVRLGAHLLAEGRAGEDVRESAAAIESESARAGAFLGQIRPLLETGRPRRLRLAPADVLVALERSPTSPSHSARRLRIARARGLRDVAVDPDALHHVLVALVLAALDDTAEPGAVEVGARDEGGFVCFAIEGSGDLFETPPRGAAALRGTALVLACATAIVRRQAGTLRVERHETGSRVSIRLRAYAASRSRGVRASSSAAGGSRRSQTTPRAARARRQ